MRKAHSWACAIAAVLALGAVGGNGAAAAEAGRYAPENIEQTCRQLGWLCMVHALCRVTDDVRAVIRRAIAERSGRKPTPASPRRCARLGRCIFVAAASSRIRRWALIF